MLRRALVAAAPGLVIATRARAAQTPIAWGSILIYQAEILESVLPDGHALSDYIRRLKGAAEQQAQAEPSVRTAGVVFVAVAPSGRAQAWLLGVASGMPATSRERWERALNAIDAISAPGHFLFGLAFGAGGAQPYESDGPPPIPPEWEAQIPPSGVMLDDAFISRVWPAPT
jgi:hypothetical protein